MNRSSNNNNNQTPSVLPESPSLHSSHVVMVGVPAEIAVVIALASFIIGAVLTGLLCCIHHRRSLPKVKQIIEKNLVKHESLDRSNQGILKGEVSLYH
jgi:hypothetical protein